MSWSNNPWFKASFNSLALAFLFALNTAANFASGSPTLGVVGVLATFFTASEGVQFYRYGRGTESPNV